MRKRRKGTLHGIVLIAMLVLLSGFAATQIHAFPGFGGNADCSLCHNSPAIAYDERYGDMEITLDGKATEPFWQETYGKRMEVPVGGMFGANEQMVKMIFAQNTTHLFILVSWEDPDINGTDTPQYQDSDGFAICWNINAANFTAAYFSGMETPNAGEAVDSFTWKPSASETGTQVPTANRGNKTVTGSVIDYSFDSEGWHTDTFQNVQTAAAHGNITDHYEQNYQIEMVRPLVTDDPGDVQFDHDGYYEFAIAIFSGSAGASHSVSFVQSVWINGYGDTTTSPTDTDGGLAPEVLLVTSGAIVVLVIIVAVVARRRG
ncbi:MAG: ethylbenzene dehydrogenase-related protein [Candidatus Thorarchaeota archaeon]